ncbi:glycerophosphodiester phosphodiesterase [Nocardioides sp. WG-D5]|uniref:glycerophosphodiester phosphodiesterase n=1 Tax=Nocardioides luteus TaxID=1844 RepID=UPI0018CB62E2|nr:glycerophosphodiester phosphodiesterase [Nocardioides luteus]MBG6096820.1 glycerophosphoryl diester phosphodiesterase [Nocardioides luteus]
MQKRALLSAHRAAARQSGHRDNSWESLQEAVRMEVDYVEFDVHRTRDGEFVLHHDGHIRDRIGRKVRIADRTYAALSRLAPFRLVRYREALELLAAHGKHAHIDLKFASPSNHLGLPHEVDAAEIALEVMRESFIVTTMVDESVRVLRDWADLRAPETLVGLSLGGVDFRHHPLKLVRLKLSEFFPEGRIRRCRSNLVVVEHRLADVWLLRWAHRRNIKVLVWTVDNPGRLRRFVYDKRVWMVTSNHPARALLPA